MKEKLIAGLLLLCSSVPLLAQPLIWPGDWLYENFYGATNAADARDRLEISSTNYVAETPFDAVTIFTNASGELTLSTNITGANGVISNYAQIWGTEIYSTDTFYGPTVYANVVNATNLNINGGGDVTGSNGSITNFGELFATEIYALDTFYGPTVYSTTVNTTNLNVNGGGDVAGSNGAITNFAEIWATELHASDTAYAPTVIATSVGSTNFTMWGGTFDGGDGNATNLNYVSAQTILLGGTNITTMMGGGGGSGDVLADGTVPFTGTLVISNTTPTVSLKDTSAGEDDWTIYADADDLVFYSETAGGALTYDLATGTWDFGTNSIATTGPMSLGEVSISNLLYGVAWGQAPESAGTNFFADMSGPADVEFALTNDFHLAGVTNVQSIDATSRSVAFYLTSSGYAPRLVTWDTTAFPDRYTIGGSTQAFSFATNCVLVVRTSVNEGVDTNNWIISVMHDQ